MAASFCWRAFACRSDSTACGLFFAPAGAKNNPHWTYAVAFFGVTTPRILPAAAWYVPIFCVRFFRATRKNRTRLDKERTALPMAQHAICVSPNTITTKHHAAAGASAASENQPQQGYCAPVSQPASRNQHPPRSALDYRGQKRVQRDGLAGGDGQLINF